MAKKKIEENDLFLRTVRKYAPALCTCLYPSQTRELKVALKEYQNGGIPCIYDSFVNLAFEMVIADYEWEKDFKSGK